jgi:hypothetical protein
MATDGCSGVVAAVVLAANFLAAYSARDVVQRDGSLGASLKATRGRSHLET